jgi:hypothetical protein
MSPSPVDLRARDPADFRTKARWLKERADDDAEAA